MTETDTEILVELAFALWGALRYWSLPILAVIVAVRLFRLDAVQAEVPDWLVWDAWPRWLQWAAVGIVSLSTSVATALAAGAGWGAALWSSVPVAVAAVWGHKSTQWVGHLMHGIAKARDPNYQPSPFRRAASIIVPLDPRQRRRARKHG